jgi:L-asparaginase
MKPSNLFMFKFIVLFSVICVLSTANAETFGNNPKLPLVAIVTTGGTIAEKTDPATGVAIPSVSGADLVSSVPAILKIANIKLVDFSNIDSSQMTPVMWLNLSKTVNALLSDRKIAGVVVTHGTDTMSEGAFFLDLTVNSSKPVVFTGAMRDASDLSADGPINLYSAVVQASSQKGHNWGVTVTLNQSINSARDVYKENTTNVQTFTSGEKGFLGAVEKDKVLYFHNRSNILHLPLPANLPKVTLIKTFAGDDGSLVRAAVNAGAEGIVIEGVGAGNVNTNVYDAVKYALSKQVVVVITSQVTEGGVYPIYGDQGGGATLQKAGAILGGDLPSPKARILLMLALPQVGHDTIKLSKYFTDFD